MITLDSILENIIAEIIVLILYLSFWKNSDLTVFLALVLMLLGYLIIYIYNEQCPSCKKFFKAKKRIDNTIIEKFTRDWKYQPMKITLYSNGNVWKKEPVGKEKTRTENG